VLLSQDEKCIVEACFNISGYDLDELFEANEIDYDDEAILRREIAPSGKSRACSSRSRVSTWFCAGERCRGCRSCAAT